MNSNELLYLLFSYNNNKYIFFVFQIELESLNTATDDINKLEIELEVRVFAIISLSIQ